jgi:hypothetical protein
MSNSYQQPESRSARRKRMVAEMSNMRTLKWVGVALAIHLVLMVATSMGKIKELMGQAHLFGMTPAQVAAPDEAKQPETPATQPATAPARPVAAANSADAPAPPKSDADRKLEDMSKNGNPMAKKVTEASKPNELPKGPTRGLNISEDP